MSTQPTLLNELLLNFAKEQRRIDMDRVTRVIDMKQEAEQRVAAHKSTLQALTDYIQRVVVGELEKLPNYKYAVGDIPALTFEGVPKEAIDKRIKQLLSTIKVPLVVGAVPRTPKGQSVDCDVCIAKAGEPCYIQTSADEHNRTGHVYARGNQFVGKERFHVGTRLSAAAGPNQSQIKTKTKEHND